MLVIALIGINCTACFFRNRIQNQTSIAPYLSYKLCKPGEFPYPVDILQKVEIRYKKQDFNFHLKVETDEKHIALVGLNPFGGKTFSIVYDEFGEINYESQSFYSTSPFHKFLLSDYQIIFGAKNSVEKGLIGKDINIFEYREKRNGFVREIRRNKQPVIRIWYTTTNRWDGIVKLEHLERNYTFTITNLHKENN